MKFLDFLFTAFVKCALLMLISDVIPSAAGKEHKAALLVIDVQDCFLPPDGSMAVPGGDQVIPVINRIRRDHGDKLRTVVLTQDWHCPDHVSFASQHQGVRPSEVVNLTYNPNGELCYGSSVPQDYQYAVDCTGTTVKRVPQTMWPDHCIENVTSGPTSAAFSSSLTRESSDIVIKKGDSCGIDSYSGFFDNGRFHQTALDKILKDRGIDVVVVTGVALDYCVYYTSKDAHALGYKVLTVTDASRGVSQNTIQAALKDLEDTGVQLITEAQLGKALEELTSSAVQFSGSPFVYLLLMAALVVSYFSSCQ